MENLNKVEALFSQKASTWNEKYSVEGPLRYRLDAFEKQLGQLVSPPAKVLDFGCGTGNLARHLSACGFTVSACDISSKMIERARETNHSSSVNWSVLPAGWRELPFASSTFEAIVASSVFEYLDDIDTTLAECCRTLRPGGFLIATVPNSRNLLRKLENLFRPIATMAAKMPLLNRIPRLGSYAIYLRCSRNRMALDDWFALGNRARLMALEQRKSRESKPALVFLVFRKTENKA